MSVRCDQTNVHGSHCRALLLQEEHDRLEQGIGVLQARIVDAKAVRQQRREQQDALLGRVLSLRNGSSTSAACQHLRPSDPAPSPQQNAPIASMQHPQGTPVDTWQSHHTKHGALMRARPTSWDIYFQPDLLPPPIASFDGFASISYEDLLEASGAPSRIMSFSEMGCLDAVHAAQSVAAQRAGVGAARICWFVQSHYEVAPGVPLSFSTSLSSPECVASFVLHMVFAQTEVAVHGLRERQHAAGAFTMHSDEPRAASEIKRARHTARSQKHPDALSDEHGARGGKGAMEEAAIAELEGRLVAPASGAAGRSDCSTTCSDASSAGGPKSMRCGVNKVCNAQVAVRQVMHAVVATLLRCGVADTDTAWDLVRATGDQAAVVVAAFDGAARGGGGGEVPAGADAAAGGDGSAVDSTGGQPRQAGACQASAPAAPEREPGSAGDGGGGTACGSAHRTAGLHRQASDGGDGREGDTRGQHSTPSMATPATSVASGAGDVAAGRAAGLADYHARVTLTLIAVLREVRDVCYAACDRWLAARAKVRPQHPVGPSAAAHQPAPNQSAGCGAWTLIKSCVTVLHAVHFTAHSAPHVALRCYCHSRSCIWALQLSQLLQEAEVKAAPARADETWEETLVFTLTMMCVGHTLVLQDAGRVMRSLAYNTVAPSMLQYEVRLVCLVPAQRPRPRRHRHRNLALPTARVPDGAGGALAARMQPCGRAPPRPRANARRDCDPCLSDAVPRAPLSPASCHRNARRTAPRCRGLPT